MGYIFDFNTARAYDQWMKKTDIKMIRMLEHHLMMDMLQPMRGNHVLEIGCGTGLDLIPFLERGLIVTGIDPSPYMLDIARLQLGQRVDLHRESGENLPFEDNSFHYVVINHTLEFADNYQAVIEEACRVAKNRIYIGFVSRYATKEYRQTIQGMCSKNIQNQMRYFTSGKIRSVLSQLLGNVPVYSCGVCHFSIKWMRLLHRLEQTRFMQRCPFGAYIGVVATLVPRFIMRPLTLEYHHKRSPRPVPG